MNPISQMLKNKAECREAKERLYAIDRSVPVLTLDRQGLIRSVNDGCCSLLALNKESVLNRRLHDFIDNDTACHSDNVDLANIDLSRVELGKEYRAIWRCPSAEKSLGLVFYQDKTGFFVVVHDRAKAAVAEQQRADEQAQFYAQFYVFEFDQQHRISGLCKRTCELTGLGLEDVNTLSFPALPVVNDIVELTAATGNVLKFRVAAIDAKQHILCTYDPDAEQQAAAFKHARQQAVVMEQATTAILLVDPNWAVVSANAAWRTLAQRYPKQMQSAGIATPVALKAGQHLREFFHDKTTFAALQAMSDKGGEQRLAGHDFALKLVCAPWRDVDGRALGFVLEWHDTSELTRVSAASAAVQAELNQLRSAMDRTRANMMIADSDNQIVFVNTALTQMLSKAQRDIQQAYPRFDVEQLLGTELDAFFQKFSQQSQSLVRSSTPMEMQINVGSRTFQINATPVIEAGKRVATIVEWGDLSSQVAIQTEIDSMVEAAATGDFTRHLSLDGKEGFFLSLSEGLNSLVGTVEVALNDILRIFGAIARGDLSERVTRDYQGTFKQLKDDANSTAERLTDVVSKMREAATSITTSANEIAQGNLDLSKRTEQQASALEETAASMEEMMATVQQSNSNVLNANKLALESQDKATRGGQVVGETIAAMAEINRASKKISDIISVIDEIAFQTNLLALNAAVEAARAGEQGRGFAVVAGEVRNLAQRSAGAAKEIKDLIRDSVTKVESGAALVNESGETLSQIVSAVNTVTVTMEKIVLSSKEQSEGITQVNTAISQMDQMTQQNSALVEQATAAAQSMADQARALNNIVDFFSVKGAASALTARITPAPSTAKPASPAKVTPLTKLEASKKPVTTAISKKKQPIQSVEPSRSPVKKVAKLSEPSASVAHGSSALDDDDEWEDF